MRQYSESSSLIDEQAGTLNESVNLMHLMPNKPNDENEITAR